MTARVLSLFFALAVAWPADGGESLDTGGDSSAIYLVRFAEPSLARQHAAADSGTGAGTGTGRGKVNAASPASLVVLDQLDRLHGDRLAAIGRRLGRAVPAVFRYRAVLNGVAVRLSAAEATAVRELAGIDAVTRDQLYTPATDAGPVWIGASTLWDGTATAPLPATQGEGMVIAILDTGVNMDHPSFSEVTSDGFVYTNPLGTGNFLGWCDPAHPQHLPAYVCNDKLIGAWDFVEAVSSESDGPEDGNFHGSHVAATAAGNTRVWPPVSGVAPRAQLITYDVCFTVTPPFTQSCPSSAITAAIDQAILDGVDVLNLSLSGGTSPWTDPVDLALLDAVAAGVFVAAAGGNGGPGAGTIGHSAPWTATVGAGTHDRIRSESWLQNLSGGGTLPPADLLGQSYTAGYGPAPIVHAGDCTTAFGPGTWTGGEIVVCDHIGAARWVLCANAAAGGAAGCVVANIAGGTAVISSDFHAVPATHLDLTEGDELRTWLADGSGHQATLSDSSLVRDANAADLVMDSSARGPVAFDVLKPDLVAPGLAIFAAWSSAGLLSVTGEEYFLLSGTSSASPHVAGAAALLLSLRGWLSPAEIRSALMTTAETALVEADGVTLADPFDRGAGRVALERAAQAGLVLDEIATRYLAAEPAIGGDPRTLNLPSLAQDDCAGTCDWQRVVRSTLSGPVEWTVTSAGFTDLELIVSPPIFTLTGVGTTRELDISVRVDGGPLDTWVFGELVLIADDPGVPEARLPVAVIPTATVGAVPTMTVLQTALPASVPEPGALVNFTVRIDNTGPAAADLTSLVDDAHGDLDGQGTCNMPQTVALGGFYSCAFSAMVSGNAWDDVTSTTTATGSSAGVPMTAQGSVTVPVDGVAPSITVSRTAMPTQVFAPGDTVTFTISATNTSVASDVVTITSLVDDVDGSLAGQGDCAVPQVLAPGAGFSCSYSRIVAGIGGETETSTTTVGGTDDDGDLVAAADSATVDVLESVLPMVTMVVASPSDDTGQIDECQMLRVPPTELVLTFSEELTGATAGSAANYLLVSPGADRAFQSTTCSTAGDDQGITTDIAWDGGSFTTTLDTSTLGNGIYRLFACGLEDLVGNPLDGNGNGSGGDDFVRAFRVDAGNLVANGHLDCGLELWTELETTAAEINHEPSDDSAGSAASGSAAIQNFSGSLPLGLSQCVELPGGAPGGDAMWLTANYRVTTANETLDLDLDCDVKDTTGCAGTTLATPGLSLTTATTAEWRPLALGWTAPAGAVSARCELRIRAPMGTYFAAGTDALRLRQVLFADGFESGDASAWSSSVP